MCRRWIGAAVGDERDGSMAGRRGEVPEREAGPLRWDLLDDDEGVARRPRRWMLAGMALVPWIVAAAVVLRTSGAPVEAESEPVGVDERVSALTSEAASSPDPGPHRWNDAVGRDAGEVTLVESGARSVPHVGDASTLALVVARHWLGEVGARLEVPLEPARTGAYVEHLAVEAVDAPAPGTIVVSIVGVLLDVEGDRYTGARAVRVAVPVTLTSAGARIAGSPWWLPPPELAISGPAWEPVDDEAALLSAAEALSAAGYADIEVLALERSDGWPHRVEASAVAPGSSSVQRHTVWLRRHLAGFAVAGALPPPPGPETRDRDEHEVTP